MDRFQKISSVRNRLNVDTICRCCGLENDERFNILQIFEDGVEFKQKIFNMMGIQVDHYDGMPQNICAICYDKINDFYEFRLMALHTENQTRKALGLRPHVPKSTTPPSNHQNNPAINPKSAVVKLVDLKYSIQDKILIRKAFEKLAARDTIKERRSLTPPVIVQEPPLKKSRKDIKCKICSGTFAYQTDFQDHLIKDHVASIARYGCGSCRETFDQLSDFKAHESYHTKQRLPYECFRCLFSFLKIKDFNKHTSNYICDQWKKLPVLVEDIKCIQCNKKFLTQNLFEWHNCFIKTKGNCLKCGRYFANKKIFFKHYVLCNGKFPMDNFKAEAITPLIQTEKRGKGRPKKSDKALPQRKMTIIKAEQELNMPAITTHEDDDELDDYNEDNITYDNYGSDDDDEDGTMRNLEPQVEINHTGAKIIDIKKEKIFNDEFDSLNDGPLTVEKIRRIKREQIARQQAINIVNNAPPPSKRARVKREIENGDKCVVKVLNPFTTPPPPTLTPTATVFKIPNNLKMKIKKEKSCKSSIIIKSEKSDQNVIDEAEADPEEEAQMAKMAAIVKSEKSRKRSVVKQFINPMAIAMSKEQIGNNGSEINSLVITSVTSMVEETLIDKNNDNGISLTIAGNFNDEKMMTEIPAEFKKLMGEEMEEDDNAQQPFLEDLPIPSSLSTVDTNRIDDVVMNNSNDELEKLLEKYGSGDIQDDDIQDLLKFD